MVDGTFAPTLQDMLNSILEDELDGHLDENQHATGNRKNGKNKKQLKESPVLCWRCTCRRFTGWWRVTTQADYFNR